MLVYGDATRRETVADKLEHVQRYLDDALRVQPWIVRHGLLVAALVEAGELAQGIADRAFEARGRRDAASPEAVAAMELTLTLARLVGASWRDEETPRKASLAALARLEAVAVPGELTIKLPEGFAHYALYPETYFEAARGLAGRDLAVVGIRSIGTTLAAMVAAGAEAPCPATVRPVGHPFGRRLALADGETLGLPPACELAIADEGPGLSGSSILAVADAAAREGVEPGRTYVFPSHDNGPGGQASEEGRRFWGSARIRFRSFEELALSRTARHRLESWITDLTGEPVAPLQESSGGVWRELRFSDPADWPPAHPWQEKRKFLLTAASGTWLLKFLGLGRIGLDKFARAQELAEAGFAPQPLGFRHGFIIEHWHGEAGPIHPFGPDRPRCLAHLARYLAFRARRFPAGPDRGASAEQLFEMLQANTREELGEEAARSLDRWRPHLPALQASARRIETDNRLHLWEWLALPDGRILKADAVDHHAGHDLVGCQDVGWDIAGAAAEFTLSPGEECDLIEEIERVGSLAVDRAQLRFSTLCYSAFQLGYYREAAASTTDSGEIARLRAAAERYSSRLLALLSSGAEPEAHPAN